MEEKKYLKWYNKVGYGSGDLAGNVVYAFLSSLVMLYLTNTVGLNPGIIGTLIMVSKLFDGISDMFFGTMIDKTKSRLGKARPWMLYAYIGCAVTLVANFAIPDTLGTTAQYAWFFVAYTLLNAVFYTANNIAYASLVTFCTKNSRERVEMGSCRFIFAFSTSLLIQSVTVQFVRAAGGGAAAWRTVAVVYAVIGLIVNMISVFSIKELPEEELKAGKDYTEEKYGLVEAAKKAKVVISIEEHAPFGGLGSMVSQVVGAECPRKVVPMSLPDAPVITGTSKEVFDYYGLNAEGIAKKAKELLA